MNTRYCRCQSNTIDSSICTAGPCPGLTSLTWSPHPASTAASVDWQQPRYSGCSVGRLLSPAAPPAVVPHERPAACSRCWCGTLNGGEGRVRTFETVRCREADRVAGQGGLPGVSEPHAAMQSNTSRACTRLQSPDTVIRNILIQPDPCSHANGLSECGTRDSIQPHQALQTPSSCRRVAAPRWKRALCGPGGRGKLACTPKETSLAASTICSNVGETHPPDFGDCVR